MYCPRCGHQPISDELRFCSYCGFKLGVVKASLSESDDVQPAGLPVAPTLLRQPRQRDINIGVILMFVAALFATWIAGRGMGREAGAVTLAIIYSLIFLLSRPITKAILKLFSWEPSPDANLPASQKRLVFGATSMFLSTIVLAISSLLMVGRMRTTPFFVGLLLSFVLLLVIGRHLMRGLQYLLAEESTVVRSQSVAAPNEMAGLAPGLSSPALPGGHGAPVSIDSQRVTTAEMVSPPSITEHTTNFLDDK